VHDSTEHLRFDRRLAGRRGWISEQEIERELEQLPDVSPKAELIDAPDVSRLREEPASPQGEPS
jgi:hypothetical protein